MDFIRSICKDVPFIAIDVDLGPGVPTVLGRSGQRFTARGAACHEFGASPDRIYLRTCPLASVETTDRGLDEGIEAPRAHPGPILEGDWSARSGYEAALELVRNHRGEFTAVVSANDHMALGALSAFHENGIKVPDEISVIGFDGKPESEFYQPPLSTIYQDFATLGEVSVEYLLEMINQPGAGTKRYLLRPTLIERRSTKAIGIVSRA